MSIINLTQHAPTPEQTAAGVVASPDPGAVLRLLNFEEPPTQAEIAVRARALAALAAVTGATAAMIGGAPFLMGPLEQALRKRGITPLYSFSRRESAEETMPDGSVRKVAVFRHAGFVEGGAAERAALNA